MMSKPKRRTPRRSSAPASRPQVPQDSPLPGGGAVFSLGSPAQDQLRLQAAALAAAANGIMITDRTGTILWVNPAFSIHTGYTATEVIGKNPRLLKSGQHDAAFYRQIWETIVAGQTWRGELINRRKDGTLYYEWQTITPVRSDTGEVTHFVAIVMDISERKAAEQRIRDLNESLEQRVHERTAQLETANREMEAFAYSVSHDLRAPLRHIAGFVDLLRTSAAPTLTAESTEYLDHIAGSAQQMARLIDDLLVFSRMARAEMNRAPLDLRQLLEETIRQLRPELRGRIIRWHKGALPVVQGDAAMLRQVFLNLLSNALKYTRPRQQAVIEIGCADARAEETVVFVRDNGVGFDMRYADKLFGVFQRLHLQEEFEGTGIGLANVRRIIGRHGGRTWAEGQVNVGATFYFSLPKAASHTEG